MCAHCVAKKSLNRFAFSVKADTILLFTNNGGIRGILLLLQKNLRIDQYVLALLLESLSFLDRSRYYFFFLSNINVEVFVDNICISINLLDLDRDLFKLILFLFFQSSMGKLYCQQFVGNILEIQLEKIFISMSLNIVTCSCSIFV